MVSVAWEIISKSYEMEILYFKGKVICCAGLPQNSYHFFGEYRLVYIFSSCKYSKSCILKQFHSFIRLLENTQVTLEFRKEIIRLQSKFLREWHLYALWRMPESTWHSTLYKIFHEWILSEWISYFRTSFLKLFSVFLWELVI